MKDKSRCRARSACMGLMSLCETPGEYPQYFERAYKEKYLDGNFMDVAVGYKFKGGTCPHCGHAVPEGFLILDKEAECDSEEDR